MNLFVIDDEGTQDMHTHTQDPATQFILRPGKVFTVTRRTRNRCEVEVSEAKSFAHLSPSRLLSQFGTVSALFLTFC
jgi:hypothetical protein